MTKQYTNLKAYIDLIESEIKEGKFGLPGRRFPQTREVGEKYNVSLVTAQKVMVELRERGIIELVGKKYYLTHGRVSRSSPLGRLKDNDKRILGFHVTNIDSQYFASLVHSAGKYANKLGYRLVTASSNYKHEEEIAILNMFRDIGASGVLSCPGIYDNTAELYSSYVLPHVFIGRKPDGVNSDSVLVNNHAAGKSVAKHFFEAGYKKFGYVGFKELGQKNDPRYLVFYEGLIQEGFELPNENKFEVSADDFTNTSRITSSFLHKLKEPTAIFCFHDLIAVELLNLCKQLNLAIPEDVGICGFDNLYISRTATNALTTVGYRINEMTQTAINLLTNQIMTEQEGGVNYYIEPTIFVRDTTQKNANYKKENMISHDMLYKGIV
ncbi:MAG: substrate-binding domain-containing protein [Clostridiales bacterium]|nr:substrate-binding domain-containing protein [Clostridiales bacterium]